MFVLLIVFTAIFNPELNKKYKKGLAKGDRPGMLVINPDECINCGACETECPVEAIYEDTGVPEDQREFIKINEEAVIGLSDSDLDQRRVTSKS